MLNQNFRGFGASGHQVPIVYPRIYKFSFYNKDPDLHLEDELPERIKEINFCRFIEETKEHRFIALLGLPGSGKTTCSRRLVEQVQAQGLIWFHLTFLDMGFKQEKLTLKDLILSTLSSEFSLNIYDAVFDWIVVNQKKVVIIMDGFDQTDWTLPPECPRRPLNCPQLVEDIMYSLMNRYFLPEARLIFTSRPHAMQAIPHHLRPDATYMIGDLSPDDMRTLFFGLCGTKAEKAWDILETNTPELMNVCLCPLILQLYIKVVLSSSARTSEVTTTTRIFDAVLEKLRHSDHTRHSDINRIFARLARLSFAATSCGTETINWDQLRKFDLDAETVQDLVIPLHDDQEEACQVLEGSKKLYFCHQTFQEYFSAWHAAHHLSIKKFKKLVKKLFTDEWVVLRQFLFGILFDICTSPGEDNRQGNFLP